MRLSSMIATVVVCIVATACAPSRTGGGGGGSDVITRADIADGQFTTAYSIVQRLRPRWLRAPRAPTSFRDGVPSGDDLLDHNQGDSRTQVYLDNVHVGSISALNGIGAEEIERVEWFDGTVATQRWGTGNEGGAILIVTRRG